MCLSIPKVVVECEGEGDFAWVERDGKRERINMMLLGTQPALPCASRVQCFARRLDVAECR